MRSRVLKVFSGDCVQCVQVTVVPDVASKFLESIPLRRFGSPDEVAACAAFLVSDDASYITGETLVIAGGTHARF